MAGKIVNKHELAAILGKTPKTLTIWQAEGMPFAKSESNGAANEYNTAEVIAWLVRRETRTGPDPNSEKAALLKEQAEQARRRNAREKGELIPMTAARLVVQRAAYAIRQKIVTSGLSHSDKQALLIDIQSLRSVDFEQIDETEGDEGGGVE